MLIVLIALWGTKAQASLISIAAVIAKLRLIRTALRFSQLLNRGIACFAEMNPSIRRQMFRVLAIPTGFWGVNQFDSIRVIHRFRSKHPQVFQYSRHLERLTSSRLRRRAKSVRPVLEDSNSRVEGRPTAGPPLIAYGQQFGTNYFRPPCSARSTWAITSDAAIPSTGHIRKRTSTVGDLWPFSSSEM